MPSRTRHIGSALLIAALLLGAELIVQPVDVAASTRPAATPRPAAATATWAWVVSHKLNGSWIPARHDCGNSSGEANTITHRGSPGWYIVALPGVAPGSGETRSVLVSTLGRQPRTCAAGGWDVVGDQVNVTVRCFTRLGTPANATFVLIAGSYVATLPGMPLGGSAQVTPLGRQARHCVVSSIERTALSQRVGVRCFDLSGQPRGAKFTLAYAR
jgi:hypothetical protein